MTALHAFLRGIASGLGQACLAICAALFTASTLLLAADIALRYLFNRSMANVSEIVAIAFVYVYMLGAAALYVRNEDIVLDLVYRHFGVRTRAAWQVVVHLAIAATMAVTLVVTLQLMEIQKSVPTPLLRIPLIVEHAALAAAAAIITFSSLVDALGAALAWRRGVAPPEAAHQVL